MGGGSAIRKSGDNHSPCAGEKGINLPQGICDPGVPEPVIRGAKQAMDFGIKYLYPVPGLTGLSNFERRWLIS